MLVLTRKPQETIIVDGRIEIRVIRVQGNKIRLGIEAPQDVSIRRGEISPLGGKADATIEMAAHPPLTMPK